MKSLFFAFAVFASTSAFASGMELEGPAYMTSYANQLVITVQGEKAAAVLERLANNKMRHEFKTTAIVSCDVKNVCDIYWDNK